MNKHSDELIHVFIGRQGRSGVDCDATIVSYVKPTRSGMLICESIGNRRCSAISGVLDEECNSCGNARNYEPSRDWDVDETTIWLCQVDGGTAAAGV